MVLTAATAATAVPSYAHLLICSCHREVSSGGLQIMENITMFRCKWHLQTSPSRPFLSLSLFGAVYAISDHTFFFHIFLLYCYVCIVVFCVCVCWVLTQRWFLDMINIGQFIWTFIGREITLENGIHIYGSVYEPNIGRCAIDLHFCIYFSFYYYFRNIKCLLLFEFSETWRVKQEELFVPPKFDE